MEHALYAFMSHYEKDTRTTFGLSGALELIDKPFDGSYAYSIFSAQAIFEETLDNPKFKFEVTVNDSRSITGIQVKNTEKPLIFFHYLSSFFIAVLGVFILQTFYRLTISSYYEIEGLANIVMILSKKDTYTAEHSKEVANLAVFIASELGLSKKQQKILFKAGHLHDIGKIGISESILNKSGNLLKEEYEEIKRHSMIGYEIVSQFPNLKEVSLIVKHHHELMDGTGYPDGLKGDEIPFNAQILNVADIYNALTTDRPYRLGFEQNKALDMMAKMPLNQELVAILKPHFSEKNS